MNTEEQNNLVVLAIKCATGESDDTKSLAIDLAKLESTEAYSILNRVIAELGKELKGARSENTTLIAKVTKLEGEAKTAQERAIEIAAAAGVALPAGADTNKDPKNGGKTPSNLTGRARLVAAISSSLESYRTNANHL